MYKVQTPHVQTSACIISFACPPVLGRRPLVSYPKPPPSPATWSQQRGGSRTHFLRAPTLHWEAASGNIRPQGGVAVNPSFQEREDGELEMDEVAMSLGMMRLEVHVRLVILRWQPAC